VTTTLRSARRRCSRRWPSMAPARTCELSVNAQEVNCVVVAMDHGFAASRLALLDRHLERVFPCMFPQGHSLDLVGTSQRQESCWKTTEAPLADSNRRPPPYHATSAATGRNRRLTIPAVHAGSGGLARWFVRARLPPRFSKVFPSCRCRSHPGTRAPLTGVTRKFACFTGRDHLARRRRAVIAAPLPAC
jgi:hypothetical protein